MRVKLLSLLLLLVVQPSLALAQSQPGPDAPAAGPDDLAQQEAPQDEDPDAMDTANGKGNVIHDADSENSSDVGRWRRTDRFSIRSASARVASGRPRRRAASAAATRRSG